MDPKDGCALHKLAVELQKRFCPEIEGASKQSAEPFVKTEKSKPEDNRPGIVNAPLDFELKGLDAEHPYLYGRGFTAETIKHFGLGFCSRGMLKDRVAIPLHDYEGKLVGYAGRVIDNALINEENPRYRFPGSRTRDGKLCEFRKTLFLYNGFRFKTALDELIVVDSFTSVWWLTQNGLPHAVATMGSDVSDEQGALIVGLVTPKGRVWILSDGDPAGERFALSSLLKISPHRLVRWVRLGDGRQPTDVAGERLKEILGR